MNYDNPRDAVLERVITSLAVSFDLFNVNFSTSTKYRGRARYLGGVHTKVACYHTAAVVAAVFSNTCQGGYSQGPRSAKIQSNRCVFENRS